MWRQGICRGALLVTLAPASAFLALGGPAGAAGEWQQPDGGAVRHDLPAVAREPSTRFRLGDAPRVHCGSPASLHLRRFEDGSAQLLCARRVIVRISVPG